MWTSHYFILNTVFIVSCLTYKDVSTRWILSINGDIAVANNIVKKRGFTVLREIIPGHYLIRKNGKPGDWTHRIHNSIASFYQEKQVIHVEKEILKRRFKHEVSFDDPKWKQMWYLNEKFNVDSMNVALSWTNGYTGKGIVIGIVDDGVHYDHPDLQPKYVPSLSYDFFDRDSNPKPRLASSRHGTQCAGIAVAAGNNLNCIVGVAYNAKFSGLRFMNGVASTAVSEAESLSFNIDSIHIYSNSWGVQDGVSFDGPSLVTRDAILRGIQAGRHGLGSIYVFAAGNGGQTDDCNADGYVNSVYTITISSVAYDKYPAFYVENCAATLASTYSSDESDFNIISTDSQGTCSNFTGTSASAPMAAAMIALTLEARKSLTWRDVQHVIVHSSKKNSFKDRNWAVNGAGLWYSHQIGFGLLDSKTMIEKASSWMPVSKQRVCTLLTVQPNRSVTGGKHVNDAFTTDACNGTVNNVKTLEHVQIIVEFSADAHGQVTLFVSSPAGTKSKILVVRPADINSGYKKWTFTSVNFWDEKPFGTWGVTMAIPNYRYNGTLISWTLVLYGTGEETFDETKSSSTERTANDTQILLKKEETSRTKDNIVLIIVLSVLGGIIFISVIVIVLILYNLHFKNSKVTINSRE